MHADASPQSGRLDLLEHILSIVLARACPQLGASRNELHGDLHPVSGLAAEAEFGDVAAHLAGLDFLSPRMISEAPALGSFLLPRKRRSTEAT